MLQDLNITIFENKEKAQSMKTGPIDIMYKHKGDILSLNNWRLIYILSIENNIRITILANRLQNHFE